MLRHIFRVLGCGPSPKPTYLDGQTADAAVPGHVGLCRITSRKPLRTTAATRDAFAQSGHARAPGSVRQRPKLGHTFSEHHPFWEGSWRTERAALSPSLVPPTH